LKPRRPYLLRALHEWITDSGETPHIVVDAAAPGVTVPRQYVKDGKIVLNVSFSATQALKLGNDAVSFEARFSGVSHIVEGAGARDSRDLRARDRTGHDFPGGRRRPGSDGRAAERARQAGVRNARRQEEQAQAPGRQVARNASLIHAISCAPHGLP
jgi:stringent starvation protein B